MDLITRLIVNVSPGWAARRAIARERYEMIVAKRSYDAARHSRATSGWRRPSTGANAEVYSGLIGLRNGSREMVRNNGLAGKALRILASNAIATGIEIEPRTKDAGTNKELKKVHDDHCAACDYSGQSNMGGLQYLGAASMFEGGETIVRKQIVSDRKLPVPLQYQLLEGDYLNHHANGLINGAKTYQGIAVGADGKRTGYWLFAEHPGEATILSGSADFASYLVDADLIHHLYEKRRIGQMRGVPWLTPGMLKSRDLDGYEEAEMVRKRIEACVAAIVVGLDPNTDPSAKGITPMVRDASGALVESFSPGLIALATGTKDVKFTQPAQTSGFADFKRSAAYDLSAAWGVTYEQLTGDLSRVNFSSIKAGLNEFRRSIDVLQWNVIIPMMVTPMYHDFIDAAVLRGRIKVTAENADSLYDHDLVPPKFESVDALSDAQADQAEIRNFLTSPQEAIRRRGNDPARVMSQFIEWHQKLVAGGVVSDADPALAPKAGAVAGKSQGGSGNTDQTAAEEADAAENKTNAAHLNGHSNGAAHDAH